MGRSREIRRRKIVLRFLTGMAITLILVLPCHWNLPSFAQGILPESAYSFSSNLQNLPSTITASDSTSVPLFVSAAADRPAGRAVAAQKLLGNQDTPAGESPLAILSLSKIQVLGVVVAALLTLILLWNINLRKTVAKALRDIEQRNLDLQESEARFKAFFELAPFGCTVSDLQGRYRMVNQAYCRRTGMLEAQVLGHTGVELGFLSDSIISEKIHDELEHTGEISNREMVIASNLGTRHVLFSSRLIEFGGERLVLSATVDITERKRAEAALRESESNFTSLFESAPIPMAFASEVDRYRATTWNESWYRTFGYSRQEADGKSGTDIGLWVDPQDRKRFVEAVMMQNQGAGMEFQLQRFDGAVRYCQVFGSFIGKPGRQILMAAYLDITERKQAEMAVEETEERFSKAFRSSPAPMVISDIESGRFIDVNEQWLQMLGHTREETIGHTSFELGIWEDPEVRNMQGRQLRDRGAFRDKSVRFVTKSGTVRDVLWSAEIINLRGTEAMLSLLYDFTERKRVNDALQESEERFSKAFSSSPAPMIISEIESGRFIDCNEMWLQVIGYSREELIGKTSLELEIWHDLEIRKELVARIRREGFVREFPVQMVTAQAEIREILWSAELMNVGGVEVMLSQLYDYTDKKRAEREKEKLQAQLVQAQKMESVGRLAGGIAHDYNNMLGVILGHAELAMLKSDEHHPLHTHLGEIRAAAQRSAELTQQLLAFARRQTIAPKIMDLNASVTSTLQMLRLVLGENIELAWLPGPETYPVKIDPSQFDQLVMNLCVNSRDAIDGVGRISIETERMGLDDAFCLANAFFEPGDYAVLSVSDDGCGMDKETQARIFEPFFTTKGIGQGTGLGLATIYGIVKQNNGYINVYSEPGQGTTFRIYLPCFAGSAVEDRETELAIVPRGNGETVLVVEDEAVLLDINTTMLADLGYRVLAADRPAEAIHLAEEQAGNIDLLMTDVVMPEMNGRQLEGHIRKSNPAIRCLFMSGYTANVISHHGVLDKGVHFIQKPFSIKDMAKKIRNILDEKLQSRDQSGDDSAAGEYRGG